MALSKNKKKDILESLKKIVKDSKSLVFVNFHGLGSNDTNIVRKGLNEKKVGYVVAKKTLVKLALKDASYAGEIPTFLGELGVAYGTDLLDPAREVYNFQKKFDKKISILGGVFEGAFKDQAGMMTIAQIPSQLTLQAQFVNLINSPIQGFVMALSEIAKKKTV